MAVLDFPPTPRSGGTPAVDPRHPRDNCDGGGALPRRSYGLASDVPRRSGHVHTGVVSRYALDARRFRAETRRCGSSRARIAMVALTLPVTTIGRPAETAA